MVDKVTLPELSAGAAVSDDDLFISRQGADTEDVKVTASQLNTYIGGTFVPFTGAPTGVDLNTQDLVNIGQLGVGTASPSGKLHVNHPDAYSITNLANMLVAGRASYFGYNTGVKEQGLYIGTNSTGTGFIQNIDGSSAYRFAIQPYGDGLTVGSTVGMPNSSSNRLEVNGDVYVNGAAELLDASNPQMRLTHTSGSVYTDLQTDSSGHLNVTPSGSIITATADINPSADNTYDLGIEQNYEWANVYTRRVSGNNNRMVLELSGNSPLLRDHTTVGTGVLIQHRGTTVAKFGDGSGNAYMGVGTTAPARKVEILDAAGPQQRLTHTASSVYTDLQTTSNGYYHIQPSGGKTLFSGNKTLTSNAGWYYINAGTSGSAQITSSGTGQSSPVGFITAELTYADGGSGETYSNARGINFIAAMNSDSASNSYYAGYFSARTKVDGQALTARGVTGEFIMDNSSGTPTVTTGVGVDAYVGINYASATITNAYGIRVRDVSNAGTMTNTYGVHVGDLTAGTQTNTPFSFYASDANTYNYFAGNTGIGTTAPSQLLDINDDSVRIRTAKTPSSASDTGTQGQIAWDGSYIYVCTATDTWVRAPLSTW